MGNINDFIILVVIRQRVQERSLFLCENLNNIYGEFHTIFQRNCTTSYTKVVLEYGTWTNKWFL